MGINATDASEGWVSTLRCLQSGMALAPDLQRNQDSIVAEGERPGKAESALLGLHDRPHSSYEQTHLLAMCPRVFCCSCSPGVITVLL